MNTKGIKVIPIKKVGHICMKCLTETDSLHKIIIPEMGYGSSFDGEGTEIHLCEKCYEDSSPNIWSMEVKKDDYMEEYEHEKEMLDCIENLPLESKELVWNHLSYGFDSDHWENRQDWIDYRLDELSYDKCQEYNVYSPQEIKAYEERFPKCEYPINVVYDDKSKGCHCPLKPCTFGVYGQITSMNYSTGCYKCEYYKERKTTIREIKGEDEEDYKLYMISKINEDKLNKKFG